MSISSMTDNGSSSRRPTIGRAMGVTAALLAAALMASCAASSPVSEKRTVEDRAGSSQSSTVTPSTPQVSLRGEHRLGKTDARIGIVEFSDYECPYCSGFYTQIFPQLKKKYVDTGIAQFISKDLPLTRIHRQALSAALAANCAGDQGQYWEMHGALYTNQEHLGPALYFHLARDLGIDEGKYFACLEDPAQERKILRDMAEAQRLGISSTPSFVLGIIENDTMRVMRVARGSPGFEAFAQEIGNLQKQINKDAASPAK